MFRIRRNTKQNLAERLAPYTYPTIPVVESETTGTTVIAKYMRVIGRHIRTLLSH